MTVDKRLLEILCCPVSKRALVPLRRDQLQRLNAAIGAGGVLDVASQAVKEPLSDGLITDDGRVIYRIDDEIPVLLPESGIGTTQFQDFP